MATAPDAPAPARRPLAPRIAKGVGIALAALVALAAALMLFLNTGPGKRFIGTRLAGYTTASGITLRVAQIDGSIYSRFTLRGLEVSDPRGVFLTAPAITIDWRPFAYLHSKIDLRSVEAGLITLRRLPQLKPTPSDPNAPTIPDIDLSLGRLAIDRFVIEPAVDGKRHIVRLAGTAAIADRRAQIAADGAAIAAPGVAGGDRLRLRLDAVPDANRLGLDVKLQAPAGGLVDSYAHLGRPLALSIDGRGDWAAWRGRAIAGLGGQPLMNLGLTAQNGRFHALGAVRPGMMLTGPAARLTEPQIAVDATATLDQRRADTRIALHSSAFAAEAAGLLDFAQSRFGRFRIKARLLTPGAILPNLAGRDIALGATLDGAFARPAIDYALSAGSIAFGTTGVEGLSASGKAVINADRILVPVHAAARRITGLNAAAGGLVTNIRIDGDIAYQNSQIFSDNLKLRSDRIDATALVLADLKTGTYTGALKGRVNDYAVNGLGRINLVTDARLVTAPGGGFGIKGRVRVVTRKITNATLAQQLGGNAVITADIGYDPRRGATLANLRLNAPDFHITRGDGAYNLASGALRFSGAGASRTYGPFTLDATGTIANPHVVLRAARPGVGIGLAGLTATVEGSRAGYEIRANGQSDYGAFTANALVRAGQGPLAIDLRQLLIAGITARGQIVQSAAGPFAGTLFIAGSGLNGQVRLAAAGANQRADIALRAAGARLPGPGGQPVTIGSGLVNASVVLLPAGPSATGSLALVDLRTGTTLVRDARARFRYAAGSGTVALTARGSAGVPFDIAAQAQLSPQRILANLRGSANGIAFRLAQPAVATRQGSAYLLAPATIVLPQGQITVSGRYGDTIQAHAAMQGMDLSIAQAFAPTLGIGGKATGTFDLAMAGAAAVPTARARIDIAGFTRTGALTVSDPVDVALLATLDPAQGGQAAALLRRGGTILGRVKARLAPIPGGSAGWTTRLMQAPLSGGIRYNGPAEVLWTLTGIAGQTVAGPIAIGADFGGRLDQPRLVGVVRANQLRYENQTYGTTVSDIQLDGRFTQSQFVLNRLQGKAGDGSVQARGAVGIDAAGGFPINVTATLDNAQLADSDAAAARVSGSIAVTNSRAAGGLIKGDLRLAEVRYQIVRQGAAEVPELTGVRRKGDAPASPAAAAGPAPSNWKLDLHVRGDNQIFVQGMGLDSEWSTDMRVGGTTGAPVVTGKLQVVRGSYSFAGRRLTLADTSTVTFHGPLLDPELNITADTTVQGVTASINIGGTAQRPRITFTSTPTLPQDEVLSRLLFGTSVTSLTPTQALQLAAALNSLRGSGGGGLNPLGKLRGASGLDNLSVLGADKTTGRGTALSAGKYISNNIYVQVISDTRGFTQTQLTIALSRALSLLSQAGGYLGPSVSLRYSKQY
ncbi:translocation/assembly module TamB domain-containing protein [Sphingomonas morindae]|uniref:Translocation/assembly module TamB domain-containing protein n=1 Tax=Sphingomonas morindae TaxID=1541170 RepID=A0ABY4XCF8_9SPHN|nr:translocation/assembly module TamB domain-containing protein [Sphingomonas morindae]USI74411.1 translocation/assembly module TamB domain-containing protein [Sphingomonas morindae]